ncbi:MAG: hypothetical protein JWN86_127 [Planctomycetota bacterium]|nr:hypothetical protein [Planctomycetota bacterium]
MRGPRTALIALVVVTGATVTILRAQQMLGGSANVSPPSTGGAEPDPSLATRSARQLLRNGLDYLDNYHDYDRALVFLREAEARPVNDLDAKETKQLKRGIERARNGLRDVVSADTGSATKGRRAGRPGALALAPSNVPAVDTVQRASAETDAPAEPPALDLPELPVPPPSSAAPAPANLKAEAPMPTDPKSTTDPVASPAPSDPIFLTGSSPDEPAAAPAPAPAKPSEPPTAETPRPSPMPATAPAPMPAVSPVPAVEPSDPPGPPPLGELPVPTPVPVEVPTPAQVPAPAPAPVGDPTDLPALPSAPSPAPVARPAEAPVPTLPEAPAAEAPAPITDAPAPIAEPPPAVVPAPVQEAPVSPPSGTPRPRQLPLPRAEPAPRQFHVEPREIPAPPAEEADELPVLPAPISRPAPVPIAPPTSDSALAVPPAGSVAVAPVSASSLSALSPESLREVEVIVRRQDEELRRNPRPMLGTQVPPGGPANGGSETASTSRLELPRAPSPTEPRPIRVIPVPEEFVPLPAREWGPNRKYWAAAATCHMPLYFQDAVLERYGQGVEQSLGTRGRYFSYPLDDPRQSNQRNQLLQPMYSAGLFISQIALLPYNMIMDPPWEAEYDLGYYRPGDRVPADTYYLPRAGVGAIFQGVRH